MDYGIKDYLKDFTRLSYVKEEDVQPQQVSDSDEMIDCALGVNPFGFPDTVKGLFDEFPVSKLSGYPDFPYITLKKELVAYWKDIADLKTVNIKLGNGSMGVIEKVNRVFIETGSKVLGCCPQFTDFMVDVQCCGGIFDYVSLKKENNLRFDANDMIAALKSDYKMVYIDNPNNPTGQVIPLTDIEAVVAAADRIGVCVMIDEAYGEFMEKDKSAITLVNRYKNLMVLRTFSKGFGLAGIRVGYMVTSPFIGEYYSKIDGPFSISSIGEYASILALKDKDFLSVCRNRINASKTKLINALNGIKVYETDLNVPIMTLEHPNPQVDLRQQFGSRGVLTESGADFVGLGKNAVRLRIPKDIDSVIGILKDIEQQTL
jgi:histidinol-phosphate aminotransferase